jgi:hypothetical protein
MSDNQAQSKSVEFTFCGCNCEKNNRKENRKDYLTRIYGEAFWPSFFPN